MNGFTKNALRIASFIIVLSAVLSVALRFIESRDFESKSAAVQVSATNEFEDVSAHTETTPYNWYCKHMKNGQTPPLDPQMKFIEDYGGYYLDKRDNGEKVIYLTFDAGYENGNIKKILDVMKEKDVKGAFFILDNLINRNPELVEQMATDGHLICNHTASHKDMTRLDSKEEFVAELDSLKNSLKEKLNLDIAPYYRAPEGKFTQQNLMWANEAGYKTIFWSFAYADWDNERQMDCESAINKIMDGTHNGEVLLLHPTSATNAEILGTLIDRWREEGFTFGTLHQLCGEG